MPTSTTCTSSPKWCAMALMPVRYLVIFTACAAVTLRGVRPQARKVLDAAGLDRFVTVE